MRLRESFSESELASSAVITPFCDGVFPEGVGIDAFAIILDCDDDVVPLMARV